MSDPFAYETPEQTEMRHAKILKEARAQQAGEEIVRKMLPKRRYPAPSTRPTRNIPVRELDISRVIKGKLLALGFTETDNFINSDRETLAEWLTDDELAALGRALDKHKGNLRASRPMPENGAGFIAHSGCDVSEEKLKVSMRLADEADKRLSN